MFIEGRGSSSIDQQRYNFQFGGAIIREITNGKLGAMVKDAAYQSRTPDFWASCDGVGGPATYQLWGTSADGKGEPGQTNAVSHGCPPARFRNITVLNTARQRDAHPRRGAHASATRRWRRPSRPAPRTRSCR